MKKRCIGKRAYFFLLDSILALGVLAIGAFLIFTMYLKAPAEAEPTILSEDLIDFFAENKIMNVDNVEVGLGGTYWDDTQVTDCNTEVYKPNGEHTPLQQIALFYKKSQEPPPKNSCYIDLAREFILKLTANILPSQYEFELWVEDSGSSTLFYPDTERTASKDATKVLIPSKKIVYGLDEDGEIFGPYTVEVLVWQQSN